MKYILYAFFMCMSSSALTALPAKISDDQEAYTYCKTHKKSFIAIIWPIAQGKDDKIQEILNKYGHIKYQKNVYFNALQAHTILRKAHHKVTNMQEHVQWYFPSGTFGKKARIFVVTFDSIKTAITCKHAVRNIFDLQYRPIHINDTHPETMELADYFFNNASDDRPRAALRAYAQTCMYRKKLKHNDENHGNS